MTKLEDLEKRLTIVESRLNCMDEPTAEAPEVDPYLVPGVPCEVWNGGNGRRLMYFVTFDSVNKPTFKELSNGVLCVYFDHYRVLGTVWDHAPEWAEWVATDEDGESWFFKDYPDIAISKWVVDDENVLQIGYADPADWKNSLRRRPEWARRKV